MGRERSRSRSRSRERRGGEVADEQRESGDERIECNARQPLAPRRARAALCARRRRCTAADPWHLQPARPIASFAHRPPRIMPCRDSVTRADVAVAHRKTPPLAVGWCVLCVVWVSFVCAHLVPHAPPLAGRCIARGHRRTSHRIRNPATVAAMRRNQLPTDASGHVHRAAFVGLATAGCRVPLELVAPPRRRAPTSKDTGGGCAVYWPGLRWLCRCRRCTARRTVRGTHACCRVLRSLCDWSAGHRAAVRGTLRAAPHATPRHCHELRPRHTTAAAAAAAAVVEQ